MSHQCVWKSESILATSTCRWLRCDCSHPWVMFSVCMEIPYLDLISNIEGPFTGEGTEIQIHQESSLELLFSVLPKTIVAFWCGTLEQGLKTVAQTVGQIQPPSVFFKSRFPGKQPNPFIWYCLCLLPCCSGRVEWLQQRLHGQQHLKYWLTGPLQKTFDVLCLATLYTRCSVSLES